MDPQVVSHGPDPGQPSSQDFESLRSGEPLDFSFRDYAPIVPNLAATFASFVALLLAPWFCMYTLQLVWDEAIGEDGVAAYLVLTSIDESFVHALVGSLFFLVIGIILQNAVRRRAEWEFRIVWIAFVIALAVLVPESLMKGGTLVSGATVAMAIGLAFAVHWGTLNFMTEAVA